MFPDNAGRLAVGAEMQNAHSSNEATLYPNHYVDRSDGLISTDVAGDLGNFNDLALYTNFTGLLAPTTGSGNPAANAMAEFALISSDTLPNVLTTGIGLDKGVQILGNLALTDASGALLTEVPNYIISKIQSNLIIGRYLQLRVKLPARTRLTPVCFFSVPGQDVQRYYPDRTTFG